MTHSTNFAFVYIFADVPTTRDFLPFDNFDWKSLTVVAQLGSGAFGSVHYAKYEVNEKSVVIKRASAVMPKVALLEKQRCFSV